MTVRRASNIEVAWSGRWFFRRLTVTTSAGARFEFSGRALEQLESTHADGPALVGREGTRLLWWVEEHHYWDDEEMTAEEVALTLWDRDRRREGRFERLRRLRLREDDADGARRERIPIEVREFVWTRDEGRCVSCGAEDDLQFDHVIPVARGGGNTEANVQILCGLCNRRKGDAIA
jgi:hypothetical protein